jgi:hypothetical protein
MKAKKRYFIGNFSDVTDEVLSIIGCCRCDLITDAEKQTVMFKIYTSKEYPELSNFTELQKNEAIKEVEKLRGTITIPKKE